VLHDANGEVRGDAPDQVDGGVSLGDAHARRELVEAEELGFRRQRDADIEVALLAVRQVRGELLGLVASPTEARTVRARSITSRYVR